MVALCLTAGVFALCLVVGTAVLGVLRYKAEPLQTALLAPATGLAAILLSVFLINRGGIPLGIAGMPIVVGWLILSGAAVWWTRPTIPWRSYWPFLGILLFGLIATGRPMLEFGFDWVSYSNDDMANYTLAAERLVNHGFFDIPQTEELVTGQDYSLPYWFFNLGVRPGAELLTGGLSGVTHLSPHQVFMPLILALHIILISTACALACQTPRLRIAALVSCGLLVASALTSLGALYQLIGQVGGLALLAGTATVLMRPYAGLDRWAAIRHGMTLGIMGAGLFVMYPEVVPFLGLAWLVFLGVELFRRRERFNALFSVLGTAVLSGLLLLNSYSLISLAFLSSQATAGLAHADPSESLFPYFLVPSGLAVLWGFQNLVQTSGEPYLSASIAVGGILLMLSVYAAVRETWRMQPVAAVALVMFVLTADLFVQRGDFGLFKMAMYLQPFMLPTLIVTWFGISQRQALRFLPVILVAALGLPAQTAYVDRSRGFLEGIGGGLTEIPNASGSRVNSEFASLLATLGRTQVTLDTSNVVLAKFQALYLRGFPSTFTTQDFFYNIAGASPGFQLLNPNIEVAAQQLRAARSRRFKDLEFDLHDPSNPGLHNTFVEDVNGQPPQVRPDEAVFIETTSSQSLLNRWSDTSEPGVDFVKHTWSEVSNHLLFITSRLGQPYYTPDRRYVAIFQLEPDLYYPGASMAGLGRYFLFEVANPSSKVRLELDMTATLKSDAENWLPPAAVIGDTRQPIPLVGRGSARVFSPPVSPQIIDGRAYVALDMGVSGRVFPSDRTGLMDLYGVDVALDRRRLVGFGRDISAVSDEDYARVTPPTGIDSFPGGLRNKQLEYSGIYEDGWIAETSTARLLQASASMPLRVVGTVPAIGSSSDFATDLHILVDGVEAARRTLKPGDFDLRIPVGGAPGTRLVELQFSAGQHLPGRDGRVVAARLQSLGFADPSLAANLTMTADIVHADEGLLLGGGWYPVENANGDIFRWVDNDAQLELHPSLGAADAIRIDVEPGAGAAGKPLLLQVLDDSGDVLYSAELSGRENVVVRVPDAAAGARLRLHTTGGGQAIDGDPRTLNFRVFHVDWLSAVSNYDAARLLSLASSSSPDIVPSQSTDDLKAGKLPQDGLFIGLGWNQVERSAEEVFRWVDNDADIVVTAPSGSRHRLRLDLEPGPGMAGKALEADIVDASGTVLGHLKASGRQVAYVDLSTLRIGQTAVLRLHVSDGGGAPTRDDPRILNFRVFSVAWESS